MNVRAGSFLLLKLLLVASTTLACSDPNVEYVAHEDCDKYYIVIKVEARCAEGLQFNSEINACDIPKGACGIDQTTDLEIESSTDYLGDKATNSTLNASTTPFYDSTVTETSPIPVELTNSTLEENNTTISEVFTTEIEDDNESTTTNMGTSSDTQTNVTTEQPTDDVQKCPPTNEGNVVFLQHDDCEKYYVCDWGNKIEMTCSRGLHFNPTLSVCDWPKDAGCNVPTTLGTTSTDQTENEKTPVTMAENEINTSNNTTESVQVTTENESNSDQSTTIIVETTSEIFETTVIEQNSATAEDTTDLVELGTENSTNNDCPLINGDFVDFRVHEKCEKYYVCDWGKKIEMDCPKGLHFNPTLHVCDWPAQAGCNSSSTSTSERTETEIIPSTKSTSIDVTTSTSTESPDIEVVPETTSGDQECPPINQGNAVLMRHEFCEKYYVCDWGVKVEMNCPKGLHFNPTINVCDWPYNAGCEDSYTR